MKRSFIGLFLVFFSLVLIGCGENSSSSSSPSSTPQSSPPPGATFENALTISAGTSSGSTVLWNSEKVKWYKINASSGRTVSVAISFSADDGDLDLFLYSDDLSHGALDSSTGSSNNESVAAVATYSGYYYAKIKGYSGSNQSYTMTVSVKAKDGSTEEVLPIPVVPASSEKK